MTLYDLLEQARKALPQAGPPELARVLLARILDEPDVLELLHVPLLQWVQGAERERVREAEEEAFGGDGPSRLRNPSGVRPSRSDPYVNPAQEAMRELLAEACYVPGEGMVPWGSMTAALHRRRAEYLASVRNAFVKGVNTTISRHERAAEILESSHCTDLAAYAERFGALPEEVAPE